MLYNGNDYGRTGIGLAVWARKVEVEGFNDGKGRILTWVPFNRPPLVGNEFDYIRQAIGAMHISGIRSFHPKMPGLSGREDRGAESLLTPSCTAALEMTALLLNIQPGDEVIIPSFTFVSTANALSCEGPNPSSSISTAIP